MSHHRMTMKEFMDEFKSTRKTAWQYLSHAGCLDPPTRTQRKTLNEHKIYLQAVIRRETEREKDETEWDFHDIYENFCHIHGVNKMNALVIKDMFPLPSRHYQDIGSKKRLWKKKDVEDFFETYKPAPNPQLERRKNMLEKEQVKEQRKRTIPPEKALIIFFYTGQPDKYGQKIYTSINPASMFYQ